PVLTVDGGFILKVDTRNVGNLFGMWTILSGYSGSLKKARRLEILSRKLWNRETFCCEPTSEANAITLEISTSRSTETQNIPKLSCSIESELDADKAFSPTSVAVDVWRPELRRQDRMHQGHGRSCGREGHITPDDLEKMATAIKEKKDLELLSLNNRFYLLSLSNKVFKPNETSPPSRVTTESETRGSQSSQSLTDSASAESQLLTRSTTGVVRGFSPSLASSAYRSIPLLTARSYIPSDDSAAKASTVKKQSAFALGGSSSEDSYSEPNSMESNVSSAQPKKKTMFSFADASSNEEESLLPKRVQLQGQLSEGLKKPTKPTRASFRDEVAIRTIREQASGEGPFDTNEEEVEDSAIDNDYSSDWEDSSIEESSRSRIDEKTLFQRVDPQVHLPSRRSLLTTMLRHHDRKNTLTVAARASQSTHAPCRSRSPSPNGSSASRSPDSEHDSGLMMKKGLKSLAENGRAQPMAINTRSTSCDLTLSPRTTRRNMLATELTVNLCQQLLWERKQKSQTANTGLRRSHTSHNVANLKQCPDKVHMSGDKELDNSWNKYFNAGLGEYHSEGW
ncbi:hypothetical protein F5884DRAFT_687250, partial [Xylogone sp. PMI_703]